MQPLEKRAMFWFKTFYSDLRQWQRSLGKVSYTKLNEQPIAKRAVSPGKALPGYCYFFLYEPTGVKTLPFYDRFPFVLLLDKDTTSFTGLNFHYLDYYWRAWLFDNLYESRQKNPDPLKVSMKFKYNYLAAVNKYKQFRPCYRRYSIKNLRSPMLQVGETEWDVALWLPVESFMKESTSVIWMDSERKF